MGPVLGRPLAGRRLIGRRRGATAGVDLCDGLADRDRVAGLGDDSCEDARRGAWDLDVDLVCGDVADRLVGLDRIAD